MTLLPGVSFRLDGGKLVADSDRPLTDDDRQFIRNHRGEILAEVERRRRRDEVLMMLADNPGVKYAYATDTGGDPIIIAIAIRGLATFEMNIPADRYDPFRILALFEGEDTGRNSEAA